METEDPDVVLKITSDPTEAEFVQYLLENDIEQPTGIVRYFNWKKMEGTYRGRDVYAIWREEADKVGYLIRIEILSYSHRKITNEEKFVRQFLKRLKQFNYFAGAIKLTLQKANNPAQIWNKAKDRQNFYFDKISVEDLNSLPDYLRSSEKIAYSWRACEIIAELMANSELSDSVGAAFQEFMEKGIFLADVHAGNIGFARVNKFRNYEAWVITDPGHSVIVDRLSKEIG